MHSPKDVLDFWFGEPAKDPEALKAKLKRWYQGGPEVDRAIVTQFGDDVRDALGGGRDAWLAEPKGWLALLIVLDQFTRNVFRNDPKTHDGDPRARELARAALERGETRKLPLEERNFALMPFCHSENLEDQERFGVEIRALVADAPDALKPLFSLGVEQSDKYTDIIKRFGRFPHRNDLLGRTMTVSEMEFLVDWEKKRAPRGAT